MKNIVEEFYNKQVETEWSRLDRHPLEFAITKKHIDEVVGDNQSILDVGGGPGKYSFHYASLGHKVTLIDLSPGNIEFARNKQKELNVYLENVNVGNAVSLTSFSDNAFDIVLCMGPLYHITNENDRIKAIQECKRVCKNNGYIVFSFITKMAQSISVVQKFPDKIREWKYALTKGLNEGINDLEFDTGFTEAYFVDPLELESYIENNGLKVIKIAGAEGFACQSEMKLKELPKLLLDEWIDHLFKYSTDKSTLGANQHVICIAKKSRKKM